MSRDSPSRTRRVELQARQLEALNEIARIATSDLELRPMLQRITDALRQRFDWPFVALVSIDPERSAFVCEAVSSARYGGEEFVALLPGLDEQAARFLAESLRAGIQGLAIPHSGALAGVVTASLGTATVVPLPGQSSETLVEAADQALYRAKQRGKNRVLSAAT